MSWEAKPKIDVVLGLVHLGNVSMEWAVAFSQLYTQLATTRRFYLSYSRGAPIDIARNHCVDDALRLGAEWLLFIDSDEIVSADLFDRLVSKNLPICSALYYRRHKPIHPAMWRLVPGGTVQCQTCNSLYTPRAKGKYNPVCDYPRGQLVECDVIGMGAVIIHRRVLEATHHPPKEPLFSWTAQREQVVSSDVLKYAIDGIGTSEDFYACEKIKQAGFRIFCATDILVPHETVLKVVSPERMDIDSVKWGGFEFPGV